MAVSAIIRLAARAPVPIFPIVGAGSRSRVQDLTLRREVTIATSPRHASLLLIAGTVPHSLNEAVARIHDQIPQPRATVSWGAGSDPLRDGAARAIEVAEDGDPVDRLVEVFGDVVSGNVRGDPVFLPDRPPAPWKGVGPHGQGGEGMMGGKPYGRPMAEMGPARDGLMLDEVPLRVGPFFPGFPPGFTLDLTLQGDVVEGASMAPNPFASLGARGRKPSVFERAAVEPVPIAEVELARAEHHLRMLSAALGIAGLDGASRRSLIMAGDPASQGAGAFRHMGNVLRRGLRWTARHVAPLDANAVAGRGLGWVARASGVEEDARGDDHAYLSLGFSPVTHRRGDALSRLQQALDESEQAIDLARRAGTRTTSDGIVEGPHGALGGGASPHLTGLLPHVIDGLEWADVVTGVASLGIDLEDAMVAARLSGAE